MKKLLLISLSLALCSIFLFAGCAPTKDAQASSVNDDLFLAASGTVTDITVSDQTVSITVKGDEAAADVPYQTMILHVSDETIVEENGNISTYENGSINVGDVVDAYFSASAPITASEPPQGTPSKIVRTAQSGSEAQADNQNFAGTIAEITEDGDSLLVYVQKGETSEPTNDLVAVVSADTKIVSENESGASLSREDLSVGQSVTVTTDGRMTFSIPPQASALEVVIHSTVS